MSSILLSGKDEKLVKRVIASTPQSIMITGDEGYGKSTVVAYLASRLTSGKEYLYLSIDDSEHPNSITIDQIRSAKKFCTLKTNSEQEHRVISIIDADKMAEEAQNALLKLLEEPPERVTIILTSSYPASLLPTIRSRVAEYAVGGLSDQEVADWFVSKGYKSQDVAQALKRYGALPGVLSSVLEGDESSALDFIDIAKELLSESQFERLCRVDKLAKDKLAPGRLVAALNRIATATIMALPNGDAKLTKWRGILQATVDAKSCLETNASTKLVLTKLFMSF